MHALTFGGHLLHLEGRRYIWPHGLGVDFELTEASHPFGRIRLLCKPADADFRSLSILDDDGLITAATGRLKDWANRADPEIILEGWRKGLLIMINWSPPKY